MKYILMMTGTKAGVDTYKAWSQKDIQTHFAHLTALKKDLTESGEFVTTEGLAMPHQAKVVRAGTNSHADHRRRVSGGQRVPAGVLDRGRRESGAGL